jgi:hypothetical protein
LPKAFPKWIRPHPITQLLMLIVTLTYIVMAIGFIYLTWLAG